MSTGDYVVVVVVSPPSTWWWRSVIVSTVSYLHISLSYTQQRRRTGLRDGQRLVSDAEIPDIQTKQTTRQNYNYNYTLKDKEGKLATCSNMYRKSTVTGCDLQNKFTTQGMLSLKPVSYYATKFHIGYYANETWSLFLEIKDISKTMLLVRLLMCNVGCLYMEQSCVSESYWFGKTAWTGCQIHLLPHQAKN